MEPGITYQKSYLTDRKMMKVDLINPKICFLSVSAYFIIIINITYEKVAHFSRKYLGLNFL